MGYKEKYEQALRRAKKLLEDMDKGDYFASNGDVENIFPELNPESEDERIRKEIIDFLGLPHPQFVGKRDHEKWIAWLEKQGEKVTNINGEDYSIDGLYHAIRILERTIGRVTGYQSDDGILSHEAAIDAVKELYKKQGGQEHFYDFNANDWYVSKVDGKIHDMTYNPTDKVEPKFRVGDWISGYFTNYKVMAINSKGYMVEDTDGNKINILFENEKFHHLFTIEDAKAGDVLVNGSNIFIFHFINGTRLMGYCHVNIDNGRFYDDLGKNECFCLIDGIVTPATKEQRDLLFQKMKEEGYEWDSEKKELKKIEVKTLNADKVIEWLKDTINETKEYFGEGNMFYNIRLALPYNSIEDLINDFKEDFGL